MTDLTVMALASDARWLEKLWSALGEVSGCRLIVANTVDEAEEILECLGPRIVVVNGNPEVFADDQVDEVLWTNSTLPHPATVVVAADAYDSDRALSLFQMGVDEYLGDSDHWSRLPTILGQLLSLSVEGDAPRHALRVFDPSRHLRQGTCAPLRWVTAETA